MASAPRCRVPFRSVGWALVVTVLASAAAAEPPAPPIVAGFERFARSAPDSPGHLPAPAAGTLLLCELGCTACHLPPEAAAGRLAPKPGPDLTGAGTRLAPGWIATFLADPAAAVPGTTMPHALAAVPSEQRGAVITSLVAYLGTLRQEVPLPKPSGLNPIPPDFWERGTATTGRTLYHRVGCVACHAPLAGHAGQGGPTTRERVAADLDDAGLDDADRAAAGLPAPERAYASVPLEQVARKYSRRSLTEFLLVPLHARPAGRMPDMKLKAIEAADIAAALLDAFDERSADAAPASATPGPGNTNGPDADLVARGRLAFVEQRCAACHTTGETYAYAVHPAPPLAALDPGAARSCIAALAPGAALPATGAAGTAPVHYPLDASQQAALGAALVTPPVAAALAAPDDTLVRFNCLACHERDGRGGVGTGRTAFFETVGHVDLGDEGRLPPRLTGVGARLQPKWLAKVLDGSGTIRPFMQARMPIHPAAALASLPAALRAADRRAAPAAMPVVAAEDHGAVLAAAARILDTGCIQCHTLGEHGLPGVVGVNLAGVTQRVEPEWFRRLLLEPQAIRPLTKMPAFFGATAPRDILDGDAERQIAAVWHWLAEKTPAPLPARILAAAASDFELAPADRPIVFRTFMTRAGTHAIAVGFPAGVHLAFDAEHCLVAEAWRGRFLDARGTWILAKSAPPTDPLGDRALPIDTGPPVARLPADEAPWPQATSATFAGYALDATGVPTFRWTIDGDTVRERFAPAGTGLVRRISVAAAAPTTRPLLFRLAVGPDLEPRGGDPGQVAVTSADGLVVSVPADAGAFVRPESAGATKPAREWLLPLPSDGAAVEVNYRW